MACDHSGSAVLPIMWTSRFVFFVCFAYFYTVYAYDQSSEFSFEPDPTYRPDWNTFHDDDFSGKSDCKNNVTTAHIYTFETNILKINFQPKNQFGILGMSVCRDETLEDCYVAEIFGLVSGHVGYFWRKHSPNETGEALWVPGLKNKLPSTLIKSDVAAKEGTWDPEGRTLYQFILEAAGAGYDNLVRIRYNGGTAKQQEEMSFEVPLDDYSVITVASYYNDSKVEVEGTKGCTIFKRMKFEPGQDIRLSMRKPFGTIGLSLCTDSRQKDCYVLEIVGLYERTVLSYFWRKYLEENGEEGWVPGLESKLRGCVIAQGENKAVGESAWEDTRNGLTIYIKRTLEDKLEVRVFAIERYSYVFTEDVQLVFDIPSNYQFTTVGHRTIVDGKEVDGANIETLGPCYNGGELNFNVHTCKQQIPPKDPFPSPGDDYRNTFLNQQSNRTIEEDSCRVILCQVSKSKDATILDFDLNQFLKVLPIYTPKPGMAKASIVTGIIKSKDRRRHLCLSLHGIASFGGRIIVTATDASGTSNQTIHVGMLAYNDVYPLGWQDVRMSVNLPPSLQYVPLRLKLTAERETPESFVLQRSFKFCPPNGCGGFLGPFTSAIQSKLANAFEHPWNVAIFRQKINETDFHYICGGTIIRSDAVISAAHCFTDDQGKLLDGAQFKLAAGKKYNSLFHYEENQQFSHALNIFIAPRYKGEIGNFIHDIAIVRVSFTITDLVLPACLELFGTNPMQQDWFENNLSGLQPGEVGQVAGWGLHEGNIQLPELYYSKLPYVSYDVCIKAVPKSFWAYVTPDKLCAGNINGSTVSKGDSGAGLVFQIGGLWYLRGVVSTGAPGQLTYTTFTEVTQFLPWIKRVMKIDS